METKTMKQLLQDLEILYRAENKTRFELERILHEINMTKLQLLHNLNLNK